MTTKLAVFLLPLLIAAAPPTPMDAGDAAFRDWRLIDEEAKTVASNAGVLAKSKAARRDEIISLRTRFPDIAVTDDASTAEILKSLQVLRAAHLEKARPILEASAKAAHDAACGARRALIQKWDELQAVDDYKRLSLDERLNLREALDALLAEHDDPDHPCDGTRQPPL